MQIDGVMLGDKDTMLGSVVTYEDAKACGDLFKKNTDRIEGILVILPNFGDEKGVADTIKLSGLRVPILVQAYPDNLSEFNMESRRDAFCGKISVCNNLRQYGYDYSITKQHTVHPTSEAFKAELEKFIRVCKVVNGLRDVRVGAIGARPGAFNTVRYSEKILQASGISVTTIDLSDILGNAGRLDDSSPKVKEKLDEIRGYAKHDSVPSDALLRMAKLGVVISDWMKENDLKASALQCWSSMQKNFGINACTLMSMMSDKLMPSACETDVTGVVSMYALQLASNFPSALVDWNNNYADAGGAASGPMTFARISTDDTFGMIRAYTGEGSITSDALDTFGNRAVVEVKNLQEVLAYICENGFEHHVAITMGQVAGALDEAFWKYLGWENYNHL